MTPNIKGKQLENGYRPLCSVCIANYNGETYLAQCIESVLNQEEFPGEIEIVIHDDASTDRSVAFIQTRYPKIRLLKSAKNVGFCASNNRMVAASQGEFILLLNNDAALHKDALCKLYKKSLEFGDGIYGLPQYNAATGELIDIGTIFDPFLNPIPNNDKTQPDVGMVIGACLWLPKRLWETLGGFPEWFGSLAEDMYLCCLARLWGYPVKALTESGFDHWVGRSFGGGKVTVANKLSSSRKRRSLSETNKTFVMFICYPWPLLITLFPVHLLLLCVEGAVLSVLKRDSTIWRSIYWRVLQQLIKKRKKILSCRRKVQNNIKISTRLFVAPLVWLPHKLSMLLKYGIPELR